MGVYLDTKNAVDAQLVYKGLCEDVQTIISPLSPQDFIKLVISIK